MESTWEPRDLPVLEAVVRYFDEHPQGVMLRCEELAEDAAQVGPGPARRL